MALAAADADFIGGGARSGPPFEVQERRGEEEDESISLTWSRWPRLFFGVAFARDGDLEFTFVQDQLGWHKIVEMILPFGG